MRQSGRWLSTALGGVAILLVTALLPGVASAGIDDVTATVLVDVVVCADDGLDGTTRYLAGATAADADEGCRAAGPGEATIGLFESATAEDDRGAVFDRADTDDAGRVTFTYDLLQPYVYLAQGEPGTDGFSASADVAVAAGDTLQFLVVTYPDDSGAGAAGADQADAGTTDAGRADDPSAAGTTVSATVVVCDDEALAEQVRFYLGETAASRGLACRDATDGEFTVGLFASATAEEDSGALVTEAETTGGGATFAYAGGEPFVYLGVLDQESRDVAVPETGDLELLVVIYQGAAEAVDGATPTPAVASATPEPADVEEPGPAGVDKSVPADDSGSAPTGTPDTETEITGQILVCDDSSQGTRFEIGVAAADVAQDAGGACVEPAAGAYEVALYASDTGEEDRGERVSAVEVTSGGYFGFTYTGGQPFLYLGVGLPGEYPVAFSDDVPAAGGLLEVVIVD